MHFFPEGIYGLSWLGALVAAWVATRFWLAWCLRHDWMDRPGPRKIHHQPVALAGGLAIGTALITVFAGAWFIVLSKLLPGEAILNLDYGFRERGLQMVGLLGGMLIMLGIGLWDDKHLPKPGPKFMAQSLAALLVAACGIRVTLFIENPFFSYFITWFWILLVVNACNFVDNMNGLCAGLGAISALFFGIHSAMHTHYLVASLAFAVSGALIGFLPFNYPKAKSFLGDSGSHLTGFLMAVLSILPHFYHEHQPNPLAVISPLPILGIFLVDFIWVVSYRFKIGQLIYQGDNNHLSHKLVQKGISQSCTVAILWLLQILLGLSSIGLVRP
jgi:UDP-GlcNAc:undecaprenyl-phosphate/decaprenyl-phosphate GlcNAc-1-phosphate transferase